MPGSATNGAWGSSPSAMGARARRGSGPLWWKGMIMKGKLRTILEWFLSDRSDRAVNGLRWLASGMALAAILVSLVALPGAIRAHDGGHRDEVVIVPCPSEDSCTVDYYDGAWYIGPPGSLPGSVPPSQR